MSHKPSASPSADPIFDFFRSIHIIQHLSQHRMEKALPGGMLQSHFSVLSHLMRVETSNPAALAEAFQVKRPSMTNTLAKLENFGFIALLPDPEDGRGKLVQITPAGREAFLLALEAIKPLFADIVEALGAEVFTEVLPNLNRIRNFLDSHRD